MNDQEIIENLDFLLSFEMIEKADDIEVIEELEDHENSDQDDSSEAPKEGGQ